MTEWIAQDWEYVLVDVYAIEKIVKLTQTKYDDILFDMILKPIKEKFAPKKLFVISNIKVIFIIGY